MRNSDSAPANLTIFANVYVCVCVNLLIYSGFLFLNQVLCENSAAFTSPVYLEKIEHDFKMVE